MYFALQMEKPKWAKGQLFSQILASSVYDLF